MGLNKSDAVTMSYSMLKAYVKKLFGEAHS